MFYAFNSRIASLIGEINKFMTFESKTASVACQLIAISIFEYTASYN